MGVPATLWHSPVPEPRPAVPAPAASVRDALWMAVALPDLALEVHARPALTAVTTDTRRGPVVHAVSTRARDRGVEPGMPVPAALALVPELCVCRRDPAAERDALEALAGRLERFSSLVSMEEPDLVLLEVGGSLRLFGGLEKLSRCVALAVGNYRQITAVTPSPTASALLARHQHAATVTHVSDLHTVLGVLPSAVLPFPKMLRRRMSRSGVHTLQDLWRLPRTGLARRFGPELVTYLDRLRGKQPEPRRSFARPENFAAAVELSIETFEHAILVEAVRHLLARLDRFLGCRIKVLQEFRVSLFHAQTRTTLVTVRPRQATRDVARMERLFAERLRHISLPAPVIRVGLASGGRLAVAPGHSGSLFPSAQDIEADWSSVLEEIEIRLGRDAVMQLYLRDDHRPERAWDYRPVSGTAPRCPAHARPLWLFRTPRRLGYRRGRLWYAGNLHIDTDPERIEAGWWDGGLCRRDYYQATNERGARLWIFQNLISRQWYVHGLFG